MGVTYNQRQGRGGGEKNLVLPSIQQVWIADLPADQWTGEASGGQRMEWKGRTSIIVNHLEKWVHNSKTQ